MKNSRPRVYGNCDAGCKWEVPHKGDFLSLVHNIDVLDWSGSGAPYTNSVTIDRLVDEDVVIVDAPFKAYSECGLIIEQDGSTITFRVTQKPIDILSINIAVIPSTAVVEI